MKKIIIVFLTFLLLLGTSACTKNDPGKNDPEPDPTPVTPAEDDSVDLAELFTSLHANEGRWGCPSQYKSYLISFHVVDGMYIVQTATTDTSDSHHYFEAIEALKEGDTYTLRLREDGFDYVNYLLHVDASRLEKGYMMAENIYVSDSKAEYAYEAGIPMPEEVNDPTDQIPDGTMLLEDFIQLVGTDGYWIKARHTEGTCMRFFKDIHQYGLMMYHTITDDTYTYEIKEVIYDAANKVFSLSLVQHSYFGDYSSQLTIRADQFKDGILLTEDRYAGNQVMDFTYVKSPAPDRYVYYAPDVAANCEPYIEFYDDRTFVMYENLYAGMGYIRGLYTVVGDTYTCTVASNYDLTGFMGRDTLSFSFKVSGSDLILQNDICLSRKDAVFELQTLY